MLPTSCVITWSCLPTVMCAPSLQYRNESGKPEDCSQNTALPCFNIFCHTSFLPSHTPCNQVGLPRYYGAYLSIPGYLPVRRCTHINLDPIPSSTDHWQLLPISPLSPMSTSRNKNDTVSTFQSIFDAASKEYEKKTGQDLRTHTLAAKFDHCNSPDAVLDIFRKQADALDQAGKSDQGLIKWLSPAVHLLHMFSAAIAEGVGLVSLTEYLLCLSVFHKTFELQVFSPAKLIFTGIDVLLRVNLLGIFIICSSDIVPFRRLKTSSQAVVSSSTFLSACNLSSPVSISILVSHLRRK